MGVTASHRVAQEEIFGPVLSMMTFRTPEEAVERANNTPYGLNAGVRTDKLIFKIVNQLRAGVVWSNTCNKFDPTSPFGGFKESEDEVTVPPEFPGAVGRRIGWAAWDQWSR